MQSIFTKTRKKECLFSPYLFNTVLEVLASTVRQLKEIKGIQTGREKLKVSLLADDVVVHIKDPKNSTRKLLQMIKKNLSAK